MIPVLATARMTLRAPEPDDVEPLFAMLGDAETMRYWSPGPDADLQATRDRIASWLAHWRDRGFGDWVLTYGSRPAKPVGFCGIHVVPGRTLPNLGYVIDKRHWNAGLATEACRGALAATARLDLAPARIEAVARGDNVASRRVLEKCGFALVGEIYQYKGITYPMPWSVYELGLASLASIESAQSAAASANPADSSIVTRKPST